MKLNALNVRKILLYHLNQQKANQFTVKRVFRNTGLREQEDLLSPITFDMKNAWATRGEKLRKTPKEPKSIFKTN